jgi:hypothetical protein
MWKMVVKNKHKEVDIDSCNYEKDIWELLGERKIFTSQIGYDIEETIDGFVATHNGETIATYRVLRED